MEITDEFELKLSVAECFNIENFLPPSWSIDGQHKTIVSIREKMTKIMDKYREDSQSYSSTKNNSHQTKPYSETRDGKFAELRCTQDKAGDTNTKHNAEYKDDEVKRE